MSVEALVEKADKQMDYGSFKKAQKLYEQALAEIPEPKEEHELYLEIEAAIGDVLQSQGKNGEAIKQFTKLVQLPSAEGIAYLHLRLGQVAFDSEKMELAEEQLRIALELGGKELFEGEYEDYYYCATGETPPEEDE